MSSICVLATFLFSKTVIIKILVFVYAWRTVKNILLVKQSF